jgi:futalosine hydrolase
MYVIIAAATGFEIQPAIDFFQSASYDVDGLVTGAGSISTVFALTESINRRKPGIMIQAGIAGCFTDLPVTSLVAIQDEVLGDLGVWEDHRFKTIFDLNLANADTHPFTNGLLKNPYEKLLSLPGIDIVNSVTVNEITTVPATIAWYKQKHNPAVESMEGGAFHYVGLMKQVPFLQVRAISNSIGERDKAKWSIKESIEILNHKLIALIKELNTYDETYFRL